MPARAALPLLFIVAATACHPQKDTADSAYDAGPLPQFCDGPWDTTFSEATIGPGLGNYAGYYSDLGTGTLFSQKMIPAHPFLLESIRVTFEGDPGPARVHLTDTLGRSYPVIDDEAYAVMEPVEIDVAEPYAGTWEEIDVSDQQVVLAPTQHYMLSVEQMEGGPAAAIMDLADGESSFALLFLPGDTNAYGIDGNFKVELQGQSFCSWSEEQRWFGQDLAQPWSEDASSRVAMVDLDGDGHDDVVLNAGGPIAYLGDGAGGFTAGGGLFPDAGPANMLVFADVDNDGDQDAFASIYVGADNDGDGATLEEGDCDDSNAAVYPGADEVEANGLDDDCDGTVDDGLGTEDTDADGFAVRDGDCDDTQADTWPGAEEALDGRDNDCDGAVDEDFGNRILLNDGAGHFSLLADAGVGAVDPSTAAGFGDGDGDGVLDLYWGNWLEHYPDDVAVQDRYVTGLGDGTFLDQTSAAGMILSYNLSCYGVMWNDYDNDGLQDIFVGNYHLYDNHLWQNQGDGTFLDVAGEVGVAHDDEPSGYTTYPGGHTYGGDFGDVDNDGDMDLYMCNLAHPRNWPWSDPSMFVVNQGAPDFTFINLREEYGFVYDEGDVNAQFADFDHDMDLDLAIASLYTGHYSRLYRNDGEAGFTDVTYETNTAVHDSVSVVWSDVDEDGDLDLFIADRSGAPYVQLFTNRVGQDRNWLQLDLVGQSANHDAVGARVSVTAGGVTQMRDVSAGYGHANTQHSHVVHFGLADEPTIDGVEIRWPYGATETISGLEPNHRYRVVQGEGSGTVVF